MRKVPFVKGAAWLICFVIFAITFFLIIIKGESLKRFLFKEDRFGIKRIVKYFPFSGENALKEWEEKILEGRVVYKIEKDEGLSYVRAKSEKAASALYYRIRMHIKNRPLISWKWRVDEFPERCLDETIEGKKEEDFAARVYVIFLGGFFTNLRTIEYIWSENIPQGTSGVSGYSENIRVLVLEQGQASDWRHEKRDIYADYIKLFGEKPRLNIGAIAFMTDADSTETSADAVYDEIRLGYK